MTTASFEYSAQYKQVLRDYGKEHFARFKVQMTKEYHVAEMYLFIAICMSIFMYLLSHSGVTSMRPTQEHELYAVLALLAFLLGMIIRYRDEFALMDSVTYINSSKSACRKYADWLRDSYHQ